MLVQSESATTATTRGAVQWLLCRFCPEFMTGQTAMEDFRVRTQRYALDQATMSEDDFIKEECVCLHIAPSIFMTAD